MMQAEKHLTDRLWFTTYLFRKHEFEALSDASSMPVSLSIVLLFQYHGGLFRFSRKNRKVRHFCFRLQTVPSIS